MLIRAVDDANKSVNRGGGGGGSSGSNGGGGGHRSIADEKLEEIRARRKAEQLSEESSLGKRWIFL